MGQRQALEGSPIWAITSFFNPAGYEARRANYRIFRENLSVPLVAVELAFEDDFALGDDDAEIVIRLTGGDVLWQKERLLNIALKAVPPHVRKVVWLDSDIVFASDDWAERTSDALETYPLLQPYTRAYAMPKGWRPGLDPESTPEEWQAVAWQIATGMPIAEVLERKVDVHRTSYGYAWAARRDLLDAHGLYDLCILGGGDTALTRAAYQRPNPTVRFQLWDQPHADHYLAWARRFGEDVRGAVGSVEGTVYHLWHGTFADRRHYSRYVDLKPFAFDPATDIALADSGAWRWASDKPGLHHFMRDYFASRREDG
jgi:hypothetical protein